MKYEEFKQNYPGIPDHEWKSADDTCPWSPESDAGKAYMRGYMLRAWEYHQIKQNGIIKDKEDLDKAKSLLKELWYVSSNGWKCKIDELLKELNK